MTGRGGFQASTHGLTRSNQAETTLATTLQIRSSVHCRGLPPEPIMLLKADAGSCQTTSIRVMLGTI
jgi:hypothetical protein